MRGGLLFAGSGCTLVASWTRICLVLLICVGVFGTGGDRDLVVFGTGGDRDLVVFGTGGDRDLVVVGTGGGVTGVDRSCTASCGAL